MGLIVISDLFCFDFVVFGMGADETDINHLKLVLDGYDQPVCISLDVEYDTVVAKNACRTVRSFDGLQPLQLALFTSVYHALSAPSESGCLSQKDFRVFTEITRTIQNSVFPFWEQAGPSSKLSTIKAEKGMHRVTHEKLVRVFLNAPL
jgi:hypothetical protein